MVILTDVLEASSSSSKYDVFLSFRGIDTRLSFTNHLHKALEDANLKTFLDDQQIETGLYLKPELESAIKSSRASVIVLSKNYASSTWCLEELVLILEQHTKFNQIVIPVFYHVEPTDVRKQQGSFGDAMEKHKNRMQGNTNVRIAERMEIWKKALIDVSNLKGENAKGRPETKLIEEIVKDIYHRLRVPLRTTLPLLIGMKYHINFITSWLKDESSYTSDILTVYGMGGIGKTSLAKYVYELYCCEFSRSSFIENISKKCGQFNGLLGVQKQLCADISRISLYEARDSSLYLSTIENLLKNKKVFLVLDDIDSLEQLDVLLGNKGLRRGSKIIITTKDVSLTESCALFKMTSMKPKHKKHLLEGLHESASLNLLCRHAFALNDPKEGYEEVSIKLAKYCEGHPLALEVLGKSLHNRDVAYWERSLKGLKKEPGPSINNVLQMSYDSLPRKDDKDLFKYIACFFVGMDRDVAETILNACDIDATTGITHLSERCLLRIGGGNKLTMHSLIQEMGRNIVRQESPDKPWKRSLLWCHEESFKVLKQNKGKGNLLGLTLNMRMIEKEKLRGSLEVKTDALSKMDNLLILHLNYVQIRGSYQNFPEDLRWLCMEGFSSKSMPSDLPMENLVALDMSHSNIESFGMSYKNPQPYKGKQVLTGLSSKEKRLLGSLKILNLSYCYQLHSLGGFCELPALENLFLTNCTSLMEVCESIEQCGELVLVDFSYCREFRKFLGTIYKLKNTRTLTLNGCNLGELTFNEDSRNISDCNSIAIISQTSSSSIVEAISRDLKSLTICFPKSLVRLSLRDNKMSCESFPLDFSSLSMLKELYLDGNPIVSIPICVRSLPRLETLGMNECNMLVSIEHPPPTLRNLSYYKSSATNWHYLQKIKFEPEMSSLKLSFNYYATAYSSIEIEGIITIQPMTGGECLTFISHWMFGMEEMEGGDVVEITVYVYPDYDIKKCGVRVVFDDHEKEEDVLEYYKSWNHIIGGDLSAFQTTSGEYILDTKEFWRTDDNSLSNSYISIVADDSTYKEETMWFKAFSQKKSKSPA